MVDVVGRPPSYIPEIMWQIIEAVSRKDLDTVLVRAKELQYLARRAKEIIYMQDNEYHGNGNPKVE